MPSAIRGGLSERSRSSGWRAVWWRARRAIRSAVSGQHGSAPERLLYVFDYASRPVPEVDSPVEFRAIGAADLAVGRDGHLLASSNAAQSESGDVVGVLDGRVVYRAGFVCAESNRLHAIPEGLLPSGRVLYLHGGTTEPAFRGQGIHSAGARWLLRHARGLDVAHAVCMVHADNVAARRTVERLGFQLVGSVT